MNIRSRVLQMKQSTRRTARSTARSLTESALAHGLLSGAIARGVLRAHGATVSDTAKIYFGVGIRNYNLEIGDDAVIHSGVTISGLAKVQVALGYVVPRGTRIATDTIWGSGQLEAHMPVRAGGTER